MNRSLFLTPLIVSTAIASPRIESDSITTRHDMQLLRDAGAIESAVLTWPWPMGRNAFGESQLDERTYQDGQNRLLSIYRSESELGYRPTETSLSIASDKLPFRSFGHQPREQFEASISQAWLSEWFAGNISIAYADNPLDGDDLRFDGSYLAVALGNWSLALDQVDRWWGPGWDGSLILSNNARPAPAVSLTRISPDAWKTKWLNWIGPWTFTTFMGQLDNEEPLRERPNPDAGKEGEPETILIPWGSDALLFGMRIDFTPFGWKNLDIGLSRTAQWAGEGRPKDWSTFKKLLLGEDNAVNGINSENEPGNQLAGVDYRLRIPGFKIAQYAQLIGEDEDGFLPDANMLLAGIEAWGELESQNATWRAYFEWADTRAGYLRRDPESHPNRDFNTAYNHHIYKSGYRRKGKAIGHAMDGDGIMRSIGGFIVKENGDLWGAKYRNYSLNRDGAGPNSVTIAPKEGQSLELFFELDFSDSPILNFQFSNLRTSGGIHYIDEDNLATGENESDFGGHLTVITSF
ncbi:capsule assembly Wzi family protein [Pelagicoccus mobilis]|uniref:Capsule assembly Wzi family protein n=1 Tax=Pelagicoccus mobilis TaxID=415221 RepID=A0A934VPM4_9BACT|nr:capsule assembly Wzi family protein [Pelagicoccus mobilis]MBK1875674.1 capsule assembly Wzi family protein [Pelagicoccus mobilis]